MLKKLWAWLSKPSTYSIWEEAFNKLQAEKKTNGMSPEYWRIWHEEVCPAYRKLSEDSLIKHPLTDKVLSDMDKPMPQRRYF